MPSYEEVVFCSMKSKGAFKLAFLPSKHYRRSFISSNDKFLIPDEHNTSIIINFMIELVIYIRGEI